jgi:putative heme iron utilization protein
MNDRPSLEVGARIRHLARTRDRAVLSTLQRDADGWPYGSLILTACDHGAAVLMFISDLADHTRNIKLDPRVSFLFDGTGGFDDPLTGPRVTLMGRAERTENKNARARFLARHPAAVIYADFADFNLYRVVVERAHVVAGFGQIHWVDGTEVSTVSHVPLEEAEAEIVAHMNDDHIDALRSYARDLLGLEGEGWRMTGCDPDGLDLRLGGETARLDFKTPVADAAGARRELIRLAKLARGEPSES